MLTELGPFQPGTPEFNHWAGICLFLPPVIGGLAALAGGYLTDRLGRQRVLVWSIVLYGTAAFMSGFRDLAGGAHLLALHHRRRRLRGIRRGHRLADGAVPRTQRREAVLGLRRSAPRSATS